MQNLNINSPQPGAAAALGASVNFVRPYPGYGNINERQTIGSSIYHSLQMTLNRRMGRRLMYGLTYTFSKAIDTASGERGTSAPNAFDLSSERAPWDFNRTHILSSNFIWNLPNAVKSRNSAPGLMLDGWQLSGIVRMSAGKPFDVALSQDVAGIGAVQRQRPDVIADTRGPRTTEQWFNRYAFARPATGTFGNMGRNSLRLPGINK